MSRRILSEERPPPAPTPPPEPDGVITPARWLSSVALPSEKSRPGSVVVPYVGTRRPGLERTNDRYGHPVGDAVLASLAGLLRRRLRQSDVVGRLGGDEFAAIVESIGENQVVRLLERVREEFAALDQVCPDGTRFHATFSAGVSLLAPGMDANVWRNGADAALYRAKSKGRNRVAGVAG